MLAGGRPSLRLVPQTAREPQAFARPRQWRKSDSILKRFKRTSRMNGNLKFRIGDTVYHKTLDLGPGKVRFICRAEVLVAFEKALPGRYPKEELSKAEPRRSSPPGIEMPAAAA